MSQFVAFAKMQKINTASDRCDYLFRRGRWVEKKEEFIMGDDSFNGWAKLDAFESVQKRKTTHARELIISLPNEVALASETEQKAFCSELSNVLVGGQPYAWVLHQNESRTNLHMHLIFSERKEIKERLPQIYKRDVWLKEDGALAKSKAERHTLAHKKGDVKRDDEGNVLYTEVDDITFTKKDPRFFSRSFVIEINNHIRDFLKQSDLVKQFVVGIEDRKPYEVRQTHIGKVQYANEELANTVQQKNELIKEWNAVNKEIEDKGGDVATKEDVASFKAALYASVATATQYLKDIISRRLEPLKDTLRAVYERFKHLEPKEQINVEAIRITRRNRKRTASARNTTIANSSFSLSGIAIEVPKQLGELLRGGDQESNSRSTEVYRAEHSGLFTTEFLQQSRKHFANAIEAIRNESASDCFERRQFLEEFAESFGEWKAGDREGSRAFYKRLDRYPQSVFAGIDYVSQVAEFNWEDLARAAARAGVCRQRDFEFAFIASQYGEDLKPTFATNKPIERVRLEDVYEGKGSAFYDAVDDFCDKIDIAREIGGAQEFIRDLFRKYQQVVCAEFALEEAGRKQSQELQDDWGISL